MAKKDDKKIEKVIKKVATAPNSKFSRRGDRLWYRMDSAGLIFIPASNGGWACAFRTACVLKSKVDPVVLQQALNDIKPRFPSIMVHLKVGLFWHYLENSKEPLMVKKETLYPLRKFSLQSRRYVVRILYQNNRIAFECFHAISDANGAFIFLNSLVRQYLILKGVKIESFDGCKNPLDKPMPEETENAFMRYADPTKRN